MKKIKVQVSARNALSVNTKILKHSLMENIYIKALEDTNEIVEDEPSQRLYCL